MTKPPNQFVAPDDKWDTGELGRDAEYAKVVIEPVESPKDRFVRLGENFPQSASLEEIEELLLAMFRHPL